MLEFGGEQACMRRDESAAKAILARGQFWYGDIVEVNYGEIRQCHKNSAELWASDKVNRKIVTGYALSQDAMWRQHTWVIEIRGDKNIIIETTEPRIGYFGVVLLDEEAQQFHDSEV